MYNPLRHIHHFLRLDPPETPETGPAGSVSFIKSCIVPSILSIRADISFTINELQIPLPLYVLFDLNISSTRGKDGTVLTGLVRSFRQIAFLVEKVVCRPNH
jgi:hypothetical protein